MLYTLARKALFKLDPEVAHDLALKSLSVLGPGAALLGAGGTGRSPDLDDEVRWQLAFAERLSALEQALSGTEAAPAADEDRERLVATVPAGGADYLDWVRHLPDAERAGGRRWLESVRARYLEAPRRDGLV